MRAEAAREVVVVGGGLSGITAALELADRGDRVVLVEARPRLGGEAVSFRRGDLTVDNGQHVFLRCCTAYRGLLDRLGVADRVVLQPRLEVPVLRPGARPARLTRSRRLPAPFHLGAALARYGVLRPADRARAIAGALALSRLDPDDAGLDTRSLGAFLRAHHQSDALVDGLWGVIATATLNCRPDQASLQGAARVFRTGLLDDAAAGDIGHAAVPLGELHDTAAQRALAAASVDVRTGTRAADVRADAGRVTVRLTSRSGTDEFTVDDVVLAVPPRTVAALGPDLADDPAVARAAALGTSPIVNVHVLYDRPVTDLSFAAGVGTPVQWVFDRTASSGLAELRPGAQYLAVTVSAADAEIDEPSRSLADRFDRELRRLFPAAAQAVVLDAFVTRERYATFRQDVGSQARRPGAGTSVPGIHLAGAATATGWPDTMESAVRSGLAAAASVARRPRLSVREPA